ILPSLNIVSEHVVATRYAIIIGVIILLTLPFLLTSAKSVTSHSIWAHPHFSGATLAQFFYVAAQAGIFSFFINSMTVDKHNGSSIVPALPASWAGGTFEKKHWVEVRTSLSGADLANLSALAERLKSKSDAVSLFVHDNLDTKTQALLAGFPASTSETALR